MVFSNIKRVFSCKKPDQKQENKDQSIVGTSSRTATHKKRWSNLSNRASEPTSPCPRKASEHHRLHPAPPDTPTKKKWRLSFRDFFVADDGRFIWVKEIVPATPTTPVRPTYEAELPIYVAEMQALGPAYPPRSSSLSHNPGHEALHTLQALAGTGKGHRRNKSTPVPDRYQSKPTSTSSVSGAHPAIPHTIRCGHDPSPEQRPSANYSRPLSLPPVLEQDTPPSSAPSSDTSSRSSTTPHSPSSTTTASTSSWQTEESAELAADQPLMEMGKAAATVASCDEGSEQHAEGGSLIYERTVSTIQRHKAGDDDDLSTIEEETGTPSPPTTPEHLSRTTIDFTNSPVLIRLWEDAIRRQAREATAISDKQH